jgi:hypothetical protein
MKKLTLFGKSMMLSLVAVLVLMAAGACNYHKFDWAGEHIEGSGNVISEERTVGSFNSIRVIGSGKLYVTQGAEQSLMIQAEDNIMPIIDTGVEGDTLVVDTERPYTSGIGIKIYITMPDIRGFQLNGAWVLSGQNRFNVNDLDLEITGAGSIDLDLTAGRIFTEISGAGTVTLTGSADSHFLTISGAGELKAEGLEVKNYDITVSGAGNCRIFVTQSLEVQISGSGSVYYQGDPASINSNISGVGKLVKL